MVTLDYQCLAETDSEWKAYDLLGKLQKIIDKVCEDLEDLSPQFELTSTSLLVTPGGTLGHSPEIELVPSADAGNLLEIGTDGLPFVSDPGTSPALVATDSTSINFTTSSTLGHALTGVVILDVDSDNILVNNGSGLFVDGSLLESPLTFDSGLVRISDNIRWQGELKEDVLIEGTASGYSIAFERTNAQTIFDTTFSSDRADNGSLIASTVLNQTTITSQVAGLSDFTTGTNYHTNGFFNLSATRGRMAYFYPIGAASINTLKTSYVTTTESLVDIYGSQITIQSPNNTISSGALTSGKRYRILVSAGGTNFAPAGASSNAVGTEFISNGVTPIWAGSDAVKLVNGFSGNILGVGSDYGAFNVTDNAFDISAYDTTNDSLITQSNSPTSYLVEMRELGANDPDYYTKGLITISNDDFVRIGHYVPNSRSTPAAPPANDIAKTSYLDFRDALTRHYAASHAFEGSILATVLGTVSTPVASAQLELRGTTKGFLPNRMTAAQRGVIGSPATGLMVYQTDGSAGVYVYDGATWRRLNWT